MKIQKVPLSKINPAVYNPRVDLKPGDQEYEKIKKSIEEFGLVEPLIWNERTGNLVGGHQRLKVLLEQGKDHAEVSVVDLDPGREKILNIALNKIDGAWDFPKLSELLSDMREEKLDMLLTGFSDLELKQMLDGAEFDVEKDWVGMPSFEQNDEESFRHIIVHFNDEKSAAEFFEKIGQKDTGSTKSIWFPPQEKMDTEAKRYD